MALPRLWRRRRRKSDSPTKPAQPGAPPRAKTELSLAQSPQPGSGELRLDDAPRAPPARPAVQEGFDPYSSDAGFARPHAWERVDHD